MKMTHSKLLNIVLVTVLATSLFFISTTASTAEYNPWSDIDGDGDIDIYDVVRVTGIYHTSGDPTRNVTITNWPDFIVNLHTSTQPLILKGLAFESLEGLSYRLFEAKDTYEYVGWPVNEVVIESSSSPEYKEIYNQTFFYYKPALQSFEIYGEVLANLNLRFMPPNPGWASVRGNLSLTKINTNGTISELSVQNFGGTADTGAAVPYYLCQSTLIFPFSTTATINEGEIFAVKLFIESKMLVSGNYVLTHYVDPTTSQFSIIIPMTPS